MRCDGVDFRRYARTSQNSSDFSNRYMLSRVLHPLDRVFAFTNGGVGHNGDKSYERGRCGNRHLYFGHCRRMSFDLSLGDALAKTKWNFKVANCVNCH